MSIAPPTAAVSKQARRLVMRSFSWEPNDGAELSACHDCTHWHARFEYDLTDERLYLREWHDADCPVWEAAD